MFNSCVDPTAPAALDEAEAVGEVILRAHRAWAAGDGRSYAACFTAETSDVAFAGLCRDGRAANGELHGALFNCAARGAALGGVVDAFEWLSDDVALVRTASDGPAAGYQTYLMVRRDGAWRIRSFRHTRADPVASWLAHTLRPSLPFKGGWTPRSGGRVGESEATTIARSRTAPHSPTLIASRSVPPHEGEGRKPHRLNSAGSPPWAAVLMLTTRSTANRVRA